MPSWVIKARGTFGPPAAILLVQQLFVPTDGASYVLLVGLTFGLLTALMAMGMALVYRANRILNFAQADLGIVSTSLAVHLIALSGLNYFLSLAVGLLTAFILGGIVELAIIRRFFDAPRLILTVATIGVSQLLAFAAFLLPMWLWGEQPVTRQITEFPVDWSFELDSFIFSTQYFLIWIIAPVAMAAIALFLRYTDVGVAIRASAERADRALLLGIPVKRLHTYVWAVAGLLSFISLFLRAGIVGLPFGQALGLDLLLAALAALTLGRLTNMPTIVLSALALGVLQQAVVNADEIDLVLFHLSSKSDLVVAPVMGFVIIIALLLQRPGSTRAERDTSSSWRAAEEIRPVPAELRGLAEVRLVRWLGGAALALGVLALPHLLDTGDSLRASAVVIFAIICISIVVLTGWAGQVSLGQMGFVAVGGAVGAVATSQWGLDLTLAMLVAGIAGAGAAVLVGLPALRLRGLYLAVTTLAFALATTRYLLNPSFFSWVPTGTIDRPPLLGIFEIDSPTSLYYLALGTLVLSTLAVRGIRASRTGRVLVAMRENEQGIQAYGVSIMRAKLTAFALSGFLAAMAGALLVHHQGAFSLGLFEPSENLVVFTATVVGGLGTMVGGVLGAIFLKGGEWWLKGEWRFFASAVGVLVVLWALPGGLSGIVFQLRDGWLRWVATRHGIVVASLLADVRTDVPRADPVGAPTPDEVAVAFESEPAEEVAAP